MIVRRSKIFLAFVLFLMVASVVPPFMPDVRAASDWYVSTTGDDGAAGTYAAPFKTIHKAINMSVSGDAVYIMNGTYTPYNSVNLVGLDNFLLSAYPGQTVIVNGTNCPGDVNYIDAVFELKECDNTRITGFRITWSGLGGITVDDTTPECSYIRIDNMTIDECASFAVKAYHGNHIYVENNLIYNNHNNHSTPTEISEEAVSFGGVDYGYIYGNTLYGNHAENIDVKSGSTFCYVYDNWINTTSSGIVKKGSTRYCGGIGIYLDGYSTIVNNCSVYNNYLTGNNSLIQVTAELTGSVRDVLVYNNICEPNGIVSWTQSAGSCIVLGNSGYTSHTYRIDIYMNTLIGDVTGWNYACFNAPQAITYYHYNRFYNNIVWTRNTSANFSYGISLANMDPGDMSTSTFIMNYNLLYRTQGGTYGQFGVNWKATARTSGWGANSVNDNPDLTSSTDFSLTGVSPCIDAAYSPMSSSTDFVGIVRPQGAGYDIGAFEWSPVFSITGVTPVNGSSSVLQRACNLTINESHGWRFNYTLQTNATGGWYTQASGNDAVNGSLSFNYFNVTVAVRTYWWRVCLVNGSIWHNETYHFTTTGWMYPATHYFCDNENYSVTPVAGINFTNITTYLHSITFNGIGFNVSSVNPLSLNHSYFRTYPKSAASGQMLLNFSTSTTNCNVTFNLSGLKPSYQYMILNGSSMQARMTSAAGAIQWNHNLSSDHVFTLWDWPFSTPVITESPTNGTVDVSRYPRLGITAVDTGLMVTVRFYTNATGGWMLRQTNQSLASGETAWFTYTNASIYGKEYWWRVVTNNSATPNGWTNKTYHFTTRESLPAVLSGPLPVNGSVGVSLGARLEVFIVDPDGDLFNWTITTSPDVGSASGVNQGNGTKTCMVSLSFNILYNWTVSVEDASGLWTNRSYHFRTAIPLGIGMSVPYYMFVVVVRYKSNNSVMPNSLVSFGGDLFMTNAQGIAIFWKPAGTYRISVKNTGYSEAKQDVMLNADQSVVVYMDPESSGIAALPDVNAVGFMFAAVFCVFVFWLKKSNRRKKV